MRPTVAVWGSFLWQSTPPLCGLHVPHTHWTFSCIPSNACLGSVRFSRGHLRLWASSHASAAPPPFSAHSAGNATLFFGSFKMILIFLLVPCVPLIPFVNAGSTSRSPLAPASRFSSSCLSGYTSSRVICGAWLLLQGSQPWTCPQPQRAWPSTISSSCSLSGLMCSNSWTSCAPSTLF
ncbi:hypothetical protein O6H91_03G036800 [Diphasiastrum complanatum]|uniref:Uncharacterized protein n=1 Tax=Diphasiastrum complanatum TaxID=34168 RepID=A0ACC2E5J4_DIPCM|nr:hypothetical protein O6H91_03G036800 [Diphasiastrum complanatum]